MWEHIGPSTPGRRQDRPTLDTPPAAWALALRPEDGAFHFLTGTTVDEIRDQYKVLRAQLEIHGWRGTVELRQGWYTFTQGAGVIKSVATGTTHMSETVNLFPNGTDGILGELQCGMAGRTGEGPLPVDDADLPRLRLAALERHEAYVEALLKGDVAALVAAHNPLCAIAMRNYVTDESTQLSIKGSDAIGEYFSAFYEKYEVQEVRLVNRLVERWFDFGELHFLVEERGGARRSLEFCTARSPFDSEGRYWSHRRRHRSDRALIDRRTPSAEPSGGRPDSEVNGLNRASPRRGSVSRRRPGPRDREPGAPSWRCTSDLGAE
jgi:hypothetical protein